MKVLSRFLVVLCLFGFISCQSTTPPCIPILSLQFDGNIVDSSTNHHTVTPTGPVNYGENRFGQRQRAIVLTGASSLTVADSSDLDFTGTSSFTLQAWIRTNSVADAGIIGKGPTNNSVPGYRLDLKNGRPHAALTASDSNIELTGPNSVADNVWHLLTLTVSPTEVKLYADTSLIAQTVGRHPKPDSLNTGAVKIGVSPDDSHPYSGYLDGVEIRPCPETLPQILSKYELPGPATGVYSLADMPPGVLVPSSGHDTIMLGMCWDADNVVGFACGTNGTIEKTVDGGATWVKVSTGTNEALRRISFAPPIAGVLTNGIAVGESGTVVLTSDGGNSWISAGLDYTAILGGSTTVYLSDVKYLDAQHAAIVGTSPWISGGHGLMLVLSIHTSIVTQVISINPPVPASQTWKGLKFIGSCQYLGNTHVWVGGENGEIWRCTFDPSSTLNTQNSIIQETVAPPGPTFTFRSCDFFAASGGEFGLAGTDDGQVFDYTPANNWSPQSSTVPWVAGVHIRNADYGNGITDAWAAVDGVNGTQPFGKLMKKSTGNWVLNSFSSSQYPLEPWMFMTSGNAFFVTLLPHQSPINMTQLHIDKP